MVGLFQLTVHLYFKKQAWWWSLLNTYKKDSLFPNWLSLGTCYVHINVIMSSCNDWKPRNVIIIETETHILTRVITCLVAICPIIAKSQCWLFVLRASTMQISVFALKYPYLSSYIRIRPRIPLPVTAQWSQRFYVKVQGKMMHKDKHKFVFQSN